MWHPSASRDHGPAPKDLWFSCWWWHSICYGCTGLHGSDSLDYNECMWRRSPAMSSCCFLSIERVSPWWQASVSYLLSPALGVNRVLNISERWRSLSTSRCPSLSRPFCRCPWSEDKVVLVPVASSPYRRIFRILTCGTQCTYPNQRSLYFWRRACRLVN